MGNYKGYIITHKYGVQSYSNENIPKGAYKGSLLNSGPPAVFKTRGRAQGAIDRTLQYAIEKGYNNEAWLGPYKIKKLKEVEE